MKKKMSHSDFLPSVALQAGWESNRESFTGDGGSSWLVGFALQINLFEGTGKFARASEAAAGLEESRGGKEKSGR